MWPGNLIGSSTASSATADPRRHPGQRSTTSSRTADPRQPMSRSSTTGPMFRPFVRPGLRASFSRELRHRGTEGGGRVGVTPAFSLARTPVGRRSARERLEEDETMTHDLASKKVVFMVANEGIEQIELTRPWQAVERAGGRPVLAAPEAGRAQAFNHLDKADTFEVDETTEALRVEDYDAIVLPGGVA